MKTFDKMAAQGDMMIIRMPDGYQIPESFEAQKPENGKFILAHSETGHNHDVLERGVSYFTDPNDAYTALLQTTETTSLDHQRSFDRHESIEIPPGIYQIKRQREYTPEGYRRVED